MYLGQSIQEWTIKICRIQPLKSLKRYGLLSRIMIQLNKVMDTKPSSLKKDQTENIFSIFRSSFPIAAVLHEVISVSFSTISVKQLLLQNSSIATKTCKNCIFTPGYYFNPNQLLWKTNALHDNYLYTDSMKSSYPKVIVKWKKIIIQLFETITIFWYYHQRNKS